MHSQRRQQHSISSLLLPESGTVGSKTCWSNTETNYCACCMCI